MCHQREYAIILTNWQGVIILNPQKIQRINELARKKKNIGLTDEELVEQKQLYREYIGEFRSSLRGQLENMVIENPDGTTINVKNLKKKKL